MKKLLCVVFLLLVFNGCANYGTPNAVQESQMCDITFADQEMQMHSIYIIRTNSVLWEAGEKAPGMTNGLKANIQLLYASKEERYIQVKLELINVTNTTISIFDAICSFGKNNVFFHIIDADGRVKQLNSVMRLDFALWGTVIKLKPGEKYTCICEIYLGNEYMSTKNKITFNLHNKKTDFKETYPIKLKGFYCQKRAYVKSEYILNKYDINWYGMISTGTCEME